METPPFKIHVCEPGRREPVSSSCRSARRSGRSRAIRPSRRWSRWTAVATSTWQWPIAGQPLPARTSGRRRARRAGHDDRRLHRARSRIGRRLRAWSIARPRSRGGENAIPVDTMYFHHSVQELPDGNFAALRWRSGPSISMPRCRKTTSPGCAAAASWSATRLRVHRGRHGCPRARFLRHYRSLPHRLRPRCAVLDQGGGRARRRDWTHANGLIHDPSDDSFIVTIRHQDCAIKIGRRPARSRNPPHRRRLGVEPLGVPRAIFRPKRAAACLLRNDPGPADPRRCCSPRWRNRLPGEAGKSCSKAPIPSSPTGIDERAMPASRS